MEEPSNVRSLATARARRHRRGRPFPTPLTLDEVERLLRLAMKDGFDYRECQYATRTVRRWYEGLPESRARSDWVMTIVNGMTQGWALRGYWHWRRRNPHLRDLRITPQTLPELLERQRKILSNETS